MKFKTIFLAFNILLLFSFAFVFFMPFFILGGEYTRLFWRQNWYLGLAFLAVLAVLNLYFLLRWKLYTLLEAEDWRGVREHLEKKSAGGGRLSAQEIRILISTYFILSDMVGLSGLERRLRAANSRHRAVFGLELGLPHLVKNDPEAMAGYFADLAETPGVRRKDWILWNLAFARMTLRDTEGARAALEKVAATAKEPVLAVLTLYLLGSLGAGDEAVVREGREKLRKRCSAADWEREIEKARGNLEVLVIMKLVRNAGAWLYADG